MDPYVVDSIGQGAPHEKFHRHIVDSLWVLIPAKKALALDTRNYFQADRGGTKKDHLQNVAITSM